MARTRESARRNEMMIIIFLIHLTPSVVLCPSTTRTTRLHENTGCHCTNIQWVVSCNKQITLEKEANLEKRKMSLLSLEITTQIDPFVPEMKCLVPTTPWWFLGWYSWSVFAGFYIGDKKRGVTDLRVELCIHN